MTRNRWTLRQLETRRKGRKERELRANPMGLLHILSMMTLSRLLLASFLKKGLFHRIRNILRHLNRVSLFDDRLVKSV